MKPGDARPKFFGLTRPLASAAAVALVLITLGALALAVTTRLNTTQSHVSRNQQAISVNQRALAYICSTTSVLDRLVVTAADQIQLNIDNGTYAKLERRGIVTAANVKAAKATVAQYRAAHAKLTNDSPCEAFQ